MGQKPALMTEYKPVPCIVARQISETFDKEQVVILSWDAVHQLTHTTTYGKSAFDKENAAAVGEICTKAIGCDLGRKQNYEDFHRHLHPALYREAIEMLERIHAAGALLNDEFERVASFLRAAKAAHEIAPLHEVRVDG